jgi:hypothetical protein
MYNKQLGGTIDRAARRASVRPRVVDNLMDIFSHVPEEWHATMYVEANAFFLLLLCVCLFVSLRCISFLCAALI